MAISLNVPFWKYEDLRAAADRFLGKHHPDGGIPLDLEGDSPVLEAFVAELGVSI